MPISTELDMFAKRFLTGRINWWNVPRQHAITNFGNIISFVLYRKKPFQVELFIVPHETSQFTKHQHPDVDVIEFGLSGDADLFINDICTHSRDQIGEWLAGTQKTVPIRITPQDWHHGCGYTPYAFLSLQHWLHDVDPTSVGLNWIGPASSREQAALLVHQEQLSLNLAGT